MKSQRSDLGEGVFIDRFDPPAPKPGEAVPDMQFQPADWYWQIKGDTGFVWSSARSLRVAIADPAFQTWLGEGGRLTYIASIEEMRAVWGEYGLVQDAGAQYREIRARRYIAELRKPGTQEEPSFENTTGDVLDVLITQLEFARQAMSIPATPEWAALIQHIEAIKAEVPKPEVR